MSLATGFFFLERSRRPQRVLGPPRGGVHPGAGSFFSLPSDLQGVRRAKSVGAGRGQEGASAVVPQPFHQGQA